MLHLSKEAIEDLKDLLQYCKESLDRDFRSLEEQDELDERIDDWVKVCDFGLK